MGIMSFLSGILPSLATSALDAGLGALGNSQQNKYNMELAKYQNDYNTEMWHMQNEYNSPEATMQRLTHAGINPRAFQQIGQFANAEKPAEATPMSKISELSAFQGVVRQSLENSLLRQEIKKAAAETRKTGAQELYSYALAKLTHEKTGELYQNNQLTALKAVLLFAENGLDSDGIVMGEDPMVQRFQNSETVKQLISTYNERFNTQKSSGELLNSLRSFELLTKKERYRILKEYGLDTEGDSIMSALRALIRVIEKTF